MFEKSKEELNCFFHEHVAVNARDCDKARCNVSLEHLQQICQIL